MVAMQRVRVTWTGVAGTPYYTNLYAVAAGPSVSAYHAAVVGLINGIKGQISSSLTANVEGDVAIIDSATGQVQGINSVTPVNVSCTGSGTALPYQDQGLVQLLTGAYAGGRQIRGRVNIPGTLTGALGGGGLVLTGYKTVIDAAFATYLTTVGPSAGVWSKKNGNLYPITSAKTWAYFGTLRSRRD